MSRYFLIIYEIENIHLHINDSASDFFVILILLSVMYKWYKNKANCDTKFVTRMHGSVYAILMDDNKWH